MHEHEVLAERVESRAAESWYEAGARAGVPVVTARDGEVFAVALREANDAMMSRAFELGMGLPAVPGDPQHSYKNILKAGFRELYLRENFAGDTFGSNERGAR